LVPDLHIPVDPGKQWLGPLSGPARASADGPDRVPRIGLIKGRGKTQIGARPAGYRLGGFGVLGSPQNFPRQGYSADAG